MKKEDKIERLGEKFLTGFPLELPSANFSEKVMHQIVQKPINAARFTYQPLINKWGWASIFCLILAIFCYSIYFEGADFTVSQFSWLGEKMNAISIGLPTIKVPQLSETVIFSTLVFGVMAVFQISVISRFFDQCSLR